MSALLEVTGLTRTFGGLVAVSEVDLSVAPGQVMGLIGPNGAGKTTLFNLITGLLTPTAGTVRFLAQPLAGRGPHQITRMGMARTFQNIRLFGSMTARENVLVGTHCRTRAGVLGGKVVDSAGGLGAGAAPGRHHRVRGPADRRQAG